MSGRSSVAERELPKLPLGTLNSLERRHLNTTQQAVIGK
jgi:hypothetical protein